MTQPQVTKHRIEEERVIKTPGARYVARRSYVTVTRYTCSCTTPHSTTYPSRDGRYQVSGLEFHLVRHHGIPSAEASKLVKAAIKGHGY